MRKHNRPDDDDDDDPMAIARALQADHLRSGSHRGEGSPAGRSSRNAPRSRAGRGGGSTVRGGRGAAPACPSRLNPMPPPSYSTPAPARAVQPPTSRMAPRPIVPRAPATLGSVGPARESVPARSGSTVPVPAIRHTPAVANTSQRLDPVRAPAPVANVTLTAEDYDDLLVHMMKPPAPRTFRERVYPEAASQNGNGSAPSANGSAAVEAHRSTTAPQNGGGAPFVGYYQGEPSPATVATPATVITAQNGGDTPFVGYYQGEPSPATVTTAQNVGDPPFVGYYQNSPPRTTTSTTTVANTSGASAQTGPFCQGEAIQPTANGLAVQNTTPVPSLLQSQHSVAPAQTTLAEPHVFAHAEPDAPDLMDIDVEDPVPSIPVFGTIDLHNREHASATTSGFPGLPSARVGNREGHGTASNLLVETADTQKQPEQKCTCVKKPRGLGSSRWANPAPEQSNFVLSGNANNSARAECPVHNPRPVTTLTPTAPEFVPNSGSPVPPVGATLTPEVPGPSSGSALETLTLPTPTQRTATSRPPTFQVPSGDENPWILL